VLKGFTNIPKMWEPPQNSGCQKGDIKQVPYPQILDTTIKNLHSFPV